MPSVVVDEWGDEVIAGSGDVDRDAFFTLLSESGRAIPLIVDREAGDDRVGDINRALDCVE